MSLLRFFPLLGFVMAFQACTEREKVTLADNDVIAPHTVPTVKVENYVNRLFIDLLGRQPTDAEMAAEVIALKDGNLSEQVRLELINKLQWDTTFREGDSSYHIAYCRRIHELVKSRLCEGAADGEFSRLAGLARFSLRIARLEGDSVRVYQALHTIDRNLRVVQANYQYRNGEIDISEVFARMLDNGVYDVINMNSFNFVNASFDDLFNRFPTQDEFKRAYDIIEFNKPEQIFGTYASNKREYCVAMTQSRAFFEGLIVWNYILMLGREPSSQELSNHFESFYNTVDLAALQSELLKTDEYANF